MKLELGPKRWAAMTVWADIAYCLTVSSLPFFVSFRTQTFSWGAALIDRDDQWNISRSCWAGASKAFFNGNDSAGKEGGGALCLYPSVWKAEMMADIQQPDELEDRNSTLMLGEAASGLQPFHPPPYPIRMGAGCGTLPGLEIKTYADSAGLLHTAWEYLPLFQVQCGLLCSADVCASVAIGTPPAFRISDSLGRRKRSFHCGKTGASKPIALCWLPGDLVAMGDCHPLLKFTLFCLSSVSKLFHPVLDWVTFWGQLWCQHAVSRKAWTSFSGNRQQVPFAWH